MGVAEQRSEDLAQLLDVNSSITAEIRLEALLTRIVEAVSRFIGADRATLFLYDAKTDELWSIAAEGVGGQQIRFPSDGGLAGACFSAGEAINIADAYADPRFNRQVDVATGYRTTSVLTIPVKARDGRKLGVMQALNAKTGKGFTDTDIARMNALSAQAAIAIDNAKLFAEVASERNYNESILRSMSAGVVTLDPEAKVAKLNDTACRILGVTRDMLEGADARDRARRQQPLVHPRVRGRGRQRPAQAAARGRNHHRPGRQGVGQHEHRAPDRRRCGRRGSGPYRRHHRQQADAGRNAPVHDAEGGGPGDGPRR